MPDSPDCHAEVLRSICVTEKSARSFGVPQDDICCLLRVLSGTLNDSHVAGDDAVEMAAIAQKQTAHGVEAFALAENGGLGGAVGNGDAAADEGVMFIVAA